MSDPGRLASVGWMSGGMTEGGIPAMNISLPYAFIPSTIGHLIAYIGYGTLLSL